MISKNHNICIRKATSLDEEIIKNIWRESFHLPEDYLEHLFNKTSIILAHCYNVKPVTIK